MKMVVVIMMMMMMMIELLHMYVHEWWSRGGIMQYRVEEGSGVEFFFKI